MSGWLSNGASLQAVFSGSELTPLDTQMASGAQPQSDGVSLITKATAMLLFTNNASKTTVAGSRYFTSVVVGNANRAGTVVGATGIQVLIGTTGGTDNWLVELHDSLGNLVATSALAGVLVGTAGTWQQIPFTAIAMLTQGTYFMVVQTNGTTAKPAVYNFPAPVASSPILTGSATGTFGTSAAITPPTTYTANVGPVCLLY